MNSIEAKAIEIVDQLQEWLEDRDNLSEIPSASFTYSKWTCSISIGHECVWDDQDIQGEDGLTLQWCKEQWLKYVEGLRPFLPPAEVTH